MLDSYVNFGSATITASITAGATSISVIAGQGARFPDPTGSVQPFNAVIYDANLYPNAVDDPNKEIVRVTARSTDTLTIVRGQEGTSAVSHTTANTIILPITLFSLQKLAAGQGTFAGTDTGAANAYVTTISTYPPALVAGLEVSFIAANTNTTASTLNHNGFGVIAIKSFNGSALVAADISAGNLVTVRYDGTNWRLTTPPAPYTSSSVVPGKNIPNVGVIFNQVNRNQTSAITRSGSIATYTFNSHGFETGDWVRISGATQTEYNGWFQVTKTGTNTFTYPVTGTPTTPSTGTSHIDLSVSDANSWGMSLISSMEDIGTGNVRVNFTNTQSFASYNMSVSTVVSTNDDAYMSYGHTRLTTSCNSQTSENGGTGVDRGGSILLFGII